MASTDPTTNIDKVSTWDVPYAIHVDPTVPRLSKPSVPVASIATVAHPCTKSPFDGPAATSTPPPEEQWGIGLFDCFKVPAHALSAVVFPFVNGAYTAHGIRKSALLVGLSLFATYTGSIVFACVSPEYASNSDGSYDHESLRDHEEFGKYHGASATCFLLFAIGVTVLRRQVRKFHRIQGSDLEDFCASLWCSCCVVAQMSIHTRKASLKRLADTATLPAYSSA